MEGAAQIGHPAHLARLLEGYAASVGQSSVGQSSVGQSSVGQSDELLLPDGTLRPVWRGLMAHLAQLTRPEIEMRFVRGDRHLRDAGVFYRKYETSGPAERAWPLSHIPVLIADTEWQRITDGLVQRADLLERVVADIYGDNRLVADGALPAPLIAQNPAWLRPLVGVTPAGGHFLNFVAFEIGRGPDGKWWVLGDRTEAPSGAGFALENRTATTRIFPNFYARSDVRRLSGFFRAFQQALEPQPDAQGRRPRMAILTPGPMNDAYFEHTYIARHLGLLLAEGEDLTVRDGQVMVRTVDGLHPVSVLWRRLDAATCDPIELSPDSRLGTPGLVEAVRHGGLRMVNALGSGILETRALLSFLPEISRRLTGAPLALPNIATWWCGQKAERDHVLAARARMMIGPAYSTRLPFDAADGTAIGTGQDADSLRARLAQDGQGLVGQEAVTLSTTPVWSGGGLVARPMVLRVFLARTRDGWQAMPGGYARVGSKSDVAAIAMQRGGSVADVWVVGDKTGDAAPPACNSARSTGQSQAQDSGARTGGAAPPDALDTEIARSFDAVPHGVPARPTPPGDPTTAARARLVSQVAAPRPTTARRQDAEALPSRSADNLFWLGRYVERAEGNMRLFRAYHDRLGSGLSRDRPLMRTVQGLIDPHTKTEPLSAAQLALSFDRPLDDALTCAGRVRDRFSVDGMMALNDLVTAARAMAATPIPPDDIPRKVSVLLRKLTGFSGLVHENMYRSTGWRFLSLGLSLERAAQMATLMAHLGDDTAPDGALDLVLELGDSAMAHRARFTGAATAASVSDLIALDDVNPRAILYHLSRAKAHVDHLPGSSEHGRLAPVARLALRLHTRLAIETPDTLTPAKLLSLRKGLWRLSDIISGTYLQ